MISPSKRSPKLVYFFNLQLQQLLLSEFFIKFTTDEPTHMSVRATGNGMCSTFHFSTVVLFILFWSDDDISFKETSTINLKAKKRFTRPYYASDSDSILYDPLP